MNIAAMIGASIFRKTAVEGTKYAVKAVGGELASRELFRMRDEVADKVAPVAGKALGKIAGAIVAGNAIPLIQKEHDAFVSTAGAAVEAITANPPANQPGNNNMIATAATVGKAVAMAGVFAAGAAGILPVASLATAYAAATALPKIGQAIASRPQANEGNNFIDNVVKPLGIQAGTELLSVGLNKYVQFNWLENSFFSRIAQGKEIGKRIGAYFPASVGKYFEEGGRIAGRIDAGRYTWEPTNVAAAKSAGDMSEAFAKTAISVGRGALAQVPTSGTADMVRKGAIVVGTAAALGGIATVMPSLAFAIGPALVINAIANTVTHLRAQPAAKPIAAQENVNDAMKKVSSNLEVVSLDNNESLPVVMVP